MEVFGLLAAIIGLISAIVSRKKIIIHRSERDANPSFPRVEEARSGSEDNKSEEHPTRQRVKFVISFKLRVFGLFFSLILLIICLELGAPAILGLPAFAFFVYNFTAVAIILIYRLYERLKGRGN